MRAACNPRGLLAIAPEGQHSGRRASKGLEDGDDDLQPILDGVGDGRYEGRALLAEFEFKPLEL